MADEIAFPWRAYYERGLVTRRQFVRLTALFGGAVAAGSILSEPQPAAGALAPAAKQALHELLAGALAREGVLLLGRSERIVRCRPLGLEHVAPHAYRRFR